MTERLNDNPPDDTERDRAIDHIVDTQGVSYEMARRIYGEEPPEPPTETPGNNMDDADIPPLQHHGPFNKDVYSLHDEIRDAKFKSQLSSRIIGLKVLRLASSGRTNEYDAIATEEVRQQRVTELTYRGDESPE